MIVIMSSDHTRLFDLPSATERRLEPGETMFFPGDPVTQLALITAGRIHLLRRTVKGASVILQAAGPGDVLAEASAYSARYHCGAEAAMPSIVRLLPVSTFRKALRDDPGLAESWAAYLARSVQAARFRAEIRTLRKVSERVDAWLGEGRTLPEKGQRQDLAEELGVTREALYRELARRK
jgi:CRP-like cAMP-binding protein